MLSVNKKLIEKETKRKISKVPLESNFEFMKLLVETFGPVFLLQLQVLIAYITHLQNILIKNNV